MARNPFSSPTGGFPGPPPPREVVVSVPRGGTRNVALAFDGDVPLGDEADYELLQLPDPVVGVHSSTTTT